MTAFHGALIAVLSMALGLIGKVFFENFFSKKSKVTPEICILTRDSCKKGMEAGLKDHIEGFKNDIAKTLLIHGERLGTGDGNFEKIFNVLSELNKVLSVHSMALWELCKDRGIDCEDITRILSRKGVLD
jgi:hypothetical protein